MKPYNLGNKSKLSLHDHNICDLECCNSKYRIKSRTTIKSDIKKEIDKQL